MICHFLISCLCTFTYATDQQKNMLSGIFDTGIYDQVNMERTENPIGRLCRLKTLQLNERIIAPYQQIGNTIGILIRRTTEQHRDRQDVRERGAERANQAAQQVHQGGFFSFLRRMTDGIPIISHVTRGMDSVANAGAAERLAVEQQHLNGLLANEALAEENLPALNQRLREVEEIIQKYSEALKFDAFAGLEAYYVMKKRSYVEKLQTKIEQLFIDAHNTPSKERTYREFLENFLLIPTQYIDLPLNETPTIDKRRFQENEIFRNYTQNNQKSLFQIIFDIMCASQQEIAGRFPLRKICYLYGSPGAGKTTAATQIACFLRLPFFQTSVRVLDDLSKEGLEGKYAESKGWLNQALIESQPVTESRAKTQRRLPIPDTFQEADILRDMFRHAVYAAQLSDARAVEDVQTCSNGFLIINDFDRVLLDQRTQTSALAFFLDYLDTDKKSFMSEYFGAPLDISRLNIIITGNHRIPDDGHPSDPYSNFSRFSALRQRLDMIEFETFPKEVMETIIKSLIIECLQLKRCCQMNATQQESLMENVIRSQQDRQLSMREVKNLIENRIGRFYVEQLWEEHEKLPRESGTRSSRREN